jgi:divalent metal cation (Fe/Co/Zn/Cd) transporter
LAPALPGALAVRWGVVVGLYVLAKGLELADHAVFDLSGQLVAGHSLKHLVAACAAWPVIGALQALGQNADQR